MNKLTVRRSNIDWSFFLVAKWRYGNETPYQIHPIGGPPNSIFLTTKWRNPLLTQPGLLLVQGKGINFYCFSNSSAVAEWTASMSWKFHSHGTSVGPFAPLLTGSHPHNVEKKSPHKIQKSPPHKQITMAQRRQQTWSNLFLWVWNLVVPLRSVKHLV